MFESLHGIEIRADLCIQAPNFVWKTTDFPRAAKGYTYSIVLQILLSMYFI